MIVIAIIKIIFFKIIDKFFTSFTIKSYAANFIEFLELRIPYMSKRATKEIEKIILKEGYKNCFEWGSGSSTLWLEQFMMSIVSVEYSKKWFDEVNKRIDKNKTALVFEAPQEDTGDKNEIKSKKKGYDKYSFKNYVSTINNFENFDLIIIDGRAREYCLENSIKCLNKNGLIVFDDTYRKRYRDKIKTLPPSLKTRNIYGWSRFQMKISKLTLIYFAK